MAVSNPGKTFERDFFNSARQYSSVLRMPDSPQAFLNLRCRTCSHNQIKFTPQTPCDFILYRYPYQYLVECKSCLGRSMPFANIIADDRDKRLSALVELGQTIGVRSYVVFNWRAVENLTVAVLAARVLKYIETANRVSIPIMWTVDNGVELRCRLKKVRFDYDFSDFFPS